MIVLFFRKCSKSYKKKKIKLKIIKDNYLMINYHKFSNNNLSQTRFHLKICKFFIIIQKKNNNSKIKFNEKMEINFLI